VLTGQRPGWPHSASHCHHLISSIRGGDTKDTIQFHFLSVKNFTSRKSFSYHKIFHAWIKYQKTVWKDFCMNKFAGILSKSLSKVLATRWKI
jgi:hypothetical protein